MRNKYYLFTAALFVFIFNKIAMAWQQCKGWYGQDYPEDGPPKKLFAIAMFFKEYE